VTEALALLADINPPATSAQRLRGVSDSDLLISRTFIGLTFIPTVAFHPVPGTII
jgi:hypothetical protein